MRSARPAWLVAAGLLAAGLLAVAGGCGGPAQAARPVGPGGSGGVGAGEGSGAGDDPAFDSRTALLSADAAAASEEEAYEAAVLALAVKLYDSEAWTRTLANVAAPHDRERDGYEVVREGRGVRVTIGLARDRVAEILASLADAPWRPELPGPLAEALDDAAGQFFDRFLCERRTQLLEQECELLPVDPIVAAAQAAAGSVRLRPVYDGGLPLSRDGTPHRPVAVMVEHNLNGSWRPLADLPVATRWPASQPSPQPLGVSDRDGVVRFALPDGARFRDGDVIAYASVDRDALLGPMAALWSSPREAELAIQARHTSTNRFAVIATERVQGEPAGDAVFAPALTRALAATGARAGDPAPANLAAELAAARPAQRASVLVLLADSWRGTVDVVFLAQLDSVFASPLGAYRARYEASGRVVAYDVWTGRQVGVAEASEVASGVGEERADRAARTALAAKLAPMLRELRP